MVDICGKGTYGGSYLFSFFLSILWWAVSHCVNIYSAWVLLTKKKHLDCVAAVGVDVYNEGQTHAG